jgi:hypothetical protein
MSDQSFVLPPRVLELQHEQLLIQADQVHQADVQLATPSEEQIRSADGVFSEQQKDQDGLSTILGVTTCFLVLHDIAVDRFTTHEDDEEPPQPKDEPEEE